MAKGEEIALGLSVLGALYRDLSFIKNEMRAVIFKSKVLQIHLPFLQLWAWERWPSLAPTAHRLHTSDVRAALWSRRQAKHLSEVDVVAVLNDESQFVFRPYCDPMPG